MVFKLITTTAQNNETKPLISFISSLYSINDHYQNFVNEVKTICSNNKHIYIEFSFCNFVHTNSNEANSSLHNLLEWIKVQRNVFLKYFECFVNIPLYETWNFLISHIEGTYVSNINPDDKRPSHYLSTLLKEFDVDNTLLVVFPVYKPYNNNCHHPEKDTQKKKIWFLNRDHFYLDAKHNLQHMSLGYVTQNNYISMKDFFHYKCIVNSQDFIVRKKNLSKSFVPNCLINSCPIWKKSLHYEVGYFSQEINIPSDFLLWLQVQKYCTGRMKQIITVCCDFYFDGATNHHLTHSFTESQWNCIVNEYLMPTI